MVFWETLLFVRQGPGLFCLSSSHIYKMPRSLAEACAQARASTSSGGEVSFISPPLPQPEAAQRRPKLPSKLQDRIIPNSLCPSVLAADRFTHWLTPYGIAKLDKATHLFPVHCIVRRRLLISKCVLPSTLSSYAAGLIRFTNFVMITTFLRLIACLPPNLFYQCSLPFAAPAQ